MKTTENFSEKQESILNEAYGLVYGDRQKQYGHSHEDYKAVGRMWSAILSKFWGREVEPLPSWLCCMMMVAVKMSRAVQSPGNRDHWVDMAGYADCGDRCVGRK